MTQKQLADILKVSKTSVYNWENRGVEPSFDILRKLVKLFEVTVDQILGVKEIYH